MESNDPPINQPASTRIPPQSSAAIAYAGQTHQLGFVGPELRSSRHENVLGHHHHPHPQPFTSPQSCEIQEAIQREIEKSRIREELIMSEIVRRHILESELRRELRLERGLALSQGSDTLSPSLPSVMGFDFPGRLPVLGAMAERRLLDERIALPLSGRGMLNDNRGSGWCDTIPFRRGTNDLSVTEVKSVSEGGKEKERIILLAKPDENIAGSKRKTLNLAAGGDLNDCPSDDISRKKAREEWSCALCQVSATNEKGFNNHLEGKKHKSKEAALRAQAALKNHSSGLLSKKATKTVHVLDTVEKAGEADGQQLLHEDIKLEDRLKKSLLTTGQESSDPKREKFVVWCKVCQVGVTSQKVMDSHINGKKHQFRIKRHQQSHRTASQMKDPKPTEAIKPGNDDEQVEKSKEEECGATNAVKLDTSDEANDKDPKPTEAIKPGNDDELVEKSKEEECGATNAVKLDTSNEANHKVSAS